MHGSGRLYFEALLKRSTVGQFQPNCFPVTSVVRYYHFTYRLRAKPDRCSATYLFKISITYLGITIRLPSTVFKGQTNPHYV